MDTYAFRKLKQRSSSQRPLFFVCMCVCVCVWKTAHFSCWPLTFIEGSDLERLQVSVARLDSFSLSFFICLCLCMCACVCFNSASHSAVCNHMMTVPDEVTLNKEPALIITFVVLSDLLHSVQKKQNQKRPTMLFFSQYSHDKSQCGRKAAGSQQKQP